MSDSARATMVYDHVCALAEPLFDRWDAKRAAIGTPDALRAHQAYVRKTFVALLGGLPDQRTPLNPRISGGFERPQHIVEHVLFESRPGFIVTANLYLPKRGGPPYPAVLAPCGHSPNGKAFDPYQRLCQLLARQGFAVLTYDPLGQGERLQYFDQSSGGSSVGGPVAEHEYAGQQSLLVGVNLAAQRVWDGIRAIDYLATRDDIDLDRLGCVGCSGGGTLTTYLGAVDPRVRVAAPACYVTSRRAWLATGKLADAEQVQDGIIERGLDLVDLLAVMTPKPVLIVAGTQDFFPIEGARWTHERLRELYAVLDAKDRVALFEADFPHGIHRPQREATVRWMRRWLLDDDGEVEEPGLEIEEDAALHAAPGGQVANLGSKTVFDFTRERAVGLADRRARPIISPEGTPAALVSLLKIPEVEPSWRRAGGDVWVRPEPGVALKGRFKPSAGEGQAVVRLTAGPTDETPHEADGARLTLELRGTGTSEPADTQNDSYARTGEQGFLFYQYGMLGRTYVGARVLDALAGLAALRALSGMDALTLKASGPARIVGLLAAVLDERVTELRLDEPPPSFRSVATSARYDLHCQWFVPGILAETDVPELLELLATRGVKVTYVAGVATGWRLD